MDGSLFGWLQATVYEGVVQPALYAMGLISYAEWAFDATEWFLVGALEILLLAAVLMPLERRFGVEPITDRRAVLTDFLYTLLHRLGGFAILSFALLQPYALDVQTWLTTQGLAPVQLDDLWPGITDRPWVSLLMYLIVLDFADYLIHRGQHAWDWWWALHAVHHSQRQMTLWSDNRNHLLDDVIRAVLLSLLALMIGAAPSQFVTFIVITRLLESLQHANLNLAFAEPFNRLLVSPVFHRRHHAIGVGHEGVHRGCNFAVLLPIWDIVFRTADFRREVEPTGIRDQLQGRDYGQGFWRQQWLGLRRMLNVRA